MFNPTHFSHKNRTPFFTLFKHVQLLQIPLAHERINIQTTSTNSINQANCLDAFILSIIITTFSSPLTFLPSFRRPNTCYRRWKRNAQLGRKIDQKLKHFCRLIKEMGFKQLSVSFTRYYDKYSTFNISLNIFLHMICIVFIFKSPINA